MWIRNIFLCWFLCVVSKELIAVRIFYLKKLVAVNRDWEFLLVTQICKVYLLIIYLKTLGNLVLNQTSNILVLCALVKEKLHWFRLNTPVGEVGFIQQYSILDHKTGQADSNPSPENFPCFLCLQLLELWNHRWWIPYAFVHKYFLSFSHRFLSSFFASV